MTYAALILAAGRATRFRAAGGAEPSKILALLRGQPLVRHVALSALGALASPVILVTGHAAEAVAGAVADLPLTFIHNPDYATGLAGSLRAGLQALPASCVGALILLADMPAVTSTTLDALVTRARAHPEADAVVPVRDGRRGNPVLLGRALFPALATLSGDTGARGLLKAPGLRIEELPLDHDGIFADVDLPEHLQRLRADPDDGPPFTIS